MNITVAEPTVTAPSLTMDVKYTVEGEVTAPTEQQITDLGGALGALASVSNVVSEDVTTTAAATDPPSAADAAYHQFVSAISLVIMLLAVYQ